MKTLGLNPLAKLDGPGIQSIEIEVKKFITDVNGVIVDLVTSGWYAKLPFILFGNYDFSSGFATGFKLLPVIRDAVRGNYTPIYLCSFVQGLGSPLAFLTFGGGSNIQDEIQNGDVVHLFTDDFQNPNWFGWVILHSGFAPYAGIVNNLRSDVLKIKQINMLPSGPSLAVNAQYDQELTVIKLSPTGDYKKTGVTPSRFKNPNYAQNDLVAMPVNLSIDQFQEIGSYITVPIESINFSLQIKSF